MTLIYRAYELCTLKKDTKDELECLKDTFIANDCPIKVVDAIHRNQRRKKIRHQIVFDKVILKSSFHSRLLRKNEERASEGRNHSSFWERNFFSKVFMQLQPKPNQRQVYKMQLQIQWKSKL